MKCVTLRGITGDFEVVEGLPADLYVIEREELSRRGLEMMYGEEVEYNEGFYSEKDMNGDDVLLFVGEKGLTANYEEYLSKVVLMDFHGKTLRNMLNRKSDRADMLLYIEVTDGTTVESLEMVYTDINGNHVVLDEFYFLDMNRRETGGGENEYRMLVGLSEGDCLRFMTFDYSGSYILTVKYENSELAYVIEDR